MKTAQNLTGQIFGSWTVINRAENQGHLVAWNCRCACGTERPVLRQSLVEARSTNCGCLRRKDVAARNLKHGHAVRGEESAEWRIWRSMRRRCYDQKNKAYRYYGGRGITVCDRWRFDFAAFYADMGDWPEGHSLDRIDPEGNYEPSNCRWATFKTQTANRRPYQQKGLRGEAAPWAKLTDAQVAEIGAAEGLTQTALAQIYGVSQSRIGQIRRAARKAQQVAA